ncbi:MAG: hypothetical protein HPY74_20915 [Firmicutes bacterium]|nr:hypothetical protein [Bacillota bacterium]
MSNSYFYLIEREANRKRDNSEYKEEIGQRLLEALKEIADRYSSIQHQR